MRVLLIAPTPPACHWPQGVFFYPVVPTELAHCAALLRQHGHQVHLEQREISLLQEKFDWTKADARFEALLLKFLPELVVFFTPTASADEAFRLADITRSFLGSSANILLCGPHATALPEQTLADCPVLDAVMVGEWEWTLLEAAERGLTPGIAGLRCPTAPQKGWIPRPTCTELDSLPMPAWDLCDMAYITNRHRWLIRWLPLRTINLRTSRGCPNACSFCAAPLTAGAGVRFHSVEYVTEMLARALQSYPVEAVLFEDETFAADESRLRQLCETIQTRGWHRRLQWACCLRTDQARPDLLRTMKAAGCIQVEYGFETASNTLLQAIGKNTTVEQNLAAARHTREAGLRIYANIMFGLPGETVLDMRNTLNFIRAIRPEVISASAMAPFPGTALFRDLSEAQKKRLQWGAYTYLDQFRSSFNPTAMSDAQWRSKYLQVQKHFIKPLILRQILRDAENESSANIQHWRKRWRRFCRRHPLKAWRLPV